MYYLNETVMEEKAQYSCRDIALLEVEASHCCPHNGLCLSTSFRVEVVS